MKSKEQLYNLYEDLKNIEPSVFMKKHKLSLSDYRGLQNCVEEYSCIGKINNLFVTPIAKVFEAYGFKVKSDAFYQIR